MKSLGPAFPLYVDDFLGGTMGMSAAEIGSYMLLLCEQWRNGFVPTNGTCLARIARQRQTRLAVVLGKFEPCGEGRIRNSKMHAIRCERMDYIEEQARKGRLSAVNRGSAAVQPRGQPEGNSPSPSASAYTDIKTHTHARAPRSTWFDGLEDKTHAERYAAICERVPEDIAKPPTYEAYYQAHHAAGMDPADVHDQLAAMLDTEPPNKWHQYGFAAVIAYKLRDIARTHNREKADNRGGYAEAKMSFRELEQIRAAEAAKL